MKSVKNKKDKLYVNVENEFYQKIFVNVAKIPELNKVTSVSNCNNKTTK